MSVCKKYDDLTIWMEPTIMLVVFHDTLYFSWESTGAPNVNFRKISVRKTISDLEFSEHLL